MDTFLALDDVLQGALRRLKPPSLCSARPHEKLTSWRCAEGDGIDLDDSAAASTAVTAKGADSAFLALRDVARNGAAQDAETQHASFQVRRRRLSHSSWTHDAGACSRCPLTRVPRTGVVANTGCVVCCPLHRRASA